MTRSKQIALLALGFLIGIAVMGLQMAMSRPLTPHFGSDIYVWSSLIATTMLAMMVGYYLGGRLADRHSNSVFLGCCVLAAAAYLAVVPWLLNHEMIPDPDPFFEGLQRSVLSWLSAETPSLALGALIAANLMMFVPFTLLSFFSPFCIRLLLADAEHGGRIAGSVYSLTTFGNIIGVLGVSLGLMTVMGSQAIIWLMAGLLAVCGIGLIVLRARAVSDA
ncbi:MAG: fused MFS/spermidine synthase [Caulobacterales bacterium]|jgi:MFS family permease